MLHEPTGYRVCDFCGIGVASSLLMWDGGLIELCSLHVPVWWGENRDKEVSATYIPQPQPQPQERG